MTTLPHASACLHACQDGCGRTYDAIIVLVVDGSTLFYCIPCLQAFLVNMTKAMIEPDDPQVQEVMAGASFDNVAYVDPDAPGYTVRGHSDPTPEDEFDFDGMVEE